MQITAKSILNSPKDDTKLTKENAKITSEMYKNTSLQKIATNQNVQNVNQALDLLFNKISNKNLDQSQIAKTLQNNAVFKADSTVSMDIKSLIAFAQNEPKLSKFLTPLNDFLKHISTTDGKNLQTQIQNSGIGLESKLSSLAKEPVLPQEIKNILIKMKDENSLKDLSISDKKNILGLFDKILNSKEIFKEDLKQLKQNINDILNNITKNSPSSANKLVEVLNKLESFLELKNNDLTKNQTLHVKENIQDTLKDLLVILKNKSLSLDALDKPLKEIEILAKSINQNNLNANQTQILNLITNSNKNLNIQDKIKMMISKLKQIIQLNDKTALTTNDTQKNLSQILKTIDKNIQNLPLKQSLINENSIKQDIKQTLLHVKEASTNQENQNMKNINSLANKAITNIEINQLASFANNSINTSIPYVWDNLKDGNVSFRHGKNDDFFCQIDLNLKVYGRVNMMLMLSNDVYISILISAEKPSLKDKIQENIKDLKIALNKTNLIPLHVKFNQFEKNSNIEEFSSEFSMNLKA